MNCAELEGLICEYVDGTLGAESKALLERHLAGCAGCAELARDAAAAVAFMERAAEVEPPPELVTRILFQIPSRGHARAQWLAGFSKLLGRLAHPILQPGVARCLRPRRCATARHAGPRQGWHRPSRRQ